MTSVATATRRTGSSFVASLVAWLAPGMLWSTPALGQRIAEVQVAPPYVRMVPDAQVQLLATAYDTEGNPMMPRIVWSSSNINVAQVSEAGLVRAVGHGTAVVTAAATAGGRTRYGRTVITVGAPGADHPPAVQPAPGAPPLPAPGPVTPRFDSVILRSVINCEDPFMNSVNPARACHDVQPAIREPRGALSADGSVCRTGWARPVRLLVHVTEEGTVSEARLFLAASCPEFNAAAMDLARQLRFTPARRAGRPVRAWAQVTVRPTEPGDPNTARP